MRVSLGDMWNRSQRRGLIVLLAAIVLVLALRLALNRTSIQEAPPSPGPAAGQLADRIDPNTATVAELAAIPSLGEKRAAAVVEFRRLYSAAHPGKPAFTQISDLQSISGIGPVIAENMEPYLVFGGSSSTRP
jgi:DNA uptake protein ComE-like DNA-binding protein